VVALEKLLLLQLSSTSDFGGDRITGGIIRYVRGREGRSGIESASFDALEITSQHLEECHVIIALWVGPIIQRLQ
jgi:hypothetical protein